MRRDHDRRYLRLALIGALAAALGLAACGRKGPLDPPPSAALTNNPGASAKGKTVLYGHGQPHAPPGPKKSIPLDVLLN